MASGDKPLLFTDPDVHVPAWQFLIDASSRWSPCCSKHFVLGEHLDSRNPSTTPMAWSVI